MARTSNENHSLTLFVPIINSELKSKSNKAKQKHSLQHRFCCITKSSPKRDTLKRQGEVSAGCHFLYPPTIWHLAHYVCFCNGLLNWHFLSTSHRCVGTCTSLWTEKWSRIATVNRKAHIREWQENRKAAQNYMSPTGSVEGILSSTREHLCSSL